MVKAHRLSTTGALIVCLVGTQWSAPLIASEEVLPATAVRLSELLEDSSSELQNPTSTTPAPVASVNLEADGASGVSSVPLSTVEPLRLTLNHEVPEANVPVGETSTQVWRSAFTFVPDESVSFAQRGFRGRRGGGRNQAATAAIVFGAIGTIAGAALLVYANRPECRTNQLASGCGYGTKVVGGAVLSAGAVGIVVGTLAWR